MKKKYEDILVLLPAIIIFALLPAFMMGLLYTSHYTSFAWYSQILIRTDYFLMGKMYLFIVCVFYMVLYVVTKIVLTHKFPKFTKSFIPLAVYALLCILSTIFAKYPKIALDGGDDMFENIFVLLGYVIVTYYVSTLVNTEKAVKTLFYSFLTGTGIVCTIGAFQTIGLDIFNTKFMKTLLASTISGVRPEDINIVNPGSTFSTLYNSNYNGVFVAMALPVFLTFLLLSKGIKNKLLYLFLTAVAVIFLYGSRSNAAFLVIGVLFVFVLIFLRKVIFKYWYIVIPTFTLFICTFLIINTLRDNAFMDEIKRSLSLTKTEPKKLTQIVAGDESVDITYNGETLSISMDCSDGQLYGFYFIDSASKEVPYEINYDDSTHILTDERFPFYVTPVIYPGLLLPYEDTTNVWLENDTLSFFVLIDGYRWYFTYDENHSTYYYITEFGKCDKTEEAESAVFTDYPKLFSGRGFIWSRTIPLLKDCIFLGCGPDNYTIVFPKTDYVDYVQYGFPGTLLTKPHSMYLQIATQTGVLSLVALLVFYAIYLINSLKLYLKTDFKTFTAKLGVAILIATLGYMITGISNDSMIVTSPVFYCLLGLGIAVNRLERKTLE